MSDLGAASEPVHSGSESVEPVWPHRRRIVRAGLMEKIMSKSNDSSKLDHDTLADSELDAVTGGFKGVEHASIDSVKNWLEDDQSSVQFSIG
jgi:hypothetical protein